MAVRAELLLALWCAAAVLALCRAMPVELGTTEGDWRLVWSDEFSGTALNTSLWTAKDSPGLLSNHVRLAARCTASAFLTVGSRRASRNRS